MRRASQPLLLFYTDKGRQIFSSFQKYLSTSDLISPDLVSRYCKSVRPIVTYLQENTLVLSAMRWGIVPAGLR